MKFLDYFSAGHYFNYIGGSIRWSIGTTWSNIRDSKKYSYEEYVYGPNDSDDFMIDGLGNRVIGGITIVVVSFVILTLDS